MSRSVREKADAVATWRYIAVNLMETLARWVPTTPALEAKALFGRHIWEVAQLADQLGHRTAELRLALHQSREPLPAYASLLRAVAGEGATGDRLAACYDGIVPDLIHRFDTSLAAADPLLDEPTIRILERALAALRRMRKQRDALLAERPDLAAHDAGRLQRLVAALGTLPEITDYRPAPAGAEA